VRHHPCYKNESKLLLAQQVRHSISTLAFRGRAATWKVDLAGAGAGKSASKEDGNQGLILVDGRFPSHQIIEAKNHVASLRCFVS